MTVLECGFASRCRTLYRAKFVMTLCVVSGTRTLTLEPHTACKKGGWALAEIN